MKKHLKLLIFLALLVSRGFAQSTYVPGAYTGSSPNVVDGKTFNGFLNAQQWQVNPPANNGIANAAGSSATLTAYSITSNIVTLTANNGFIAGQLVAFTVSSGPTVINGQTLTVLSAGLSSTQFEVAFTTGNASGLATGTAVSAWSSWNIWVDPTYAYTETIGAINGDLAFSNLALNFPSNSQGGSTYRDYRAGQETTIFRNSAPGNTVLGQNSISRAVLMDSIPGWTAPSGNEHSSLEKNLLANYTPCFNFGPDPNGSVNTVGWCISDTLNNVVASWGQGIKGGVGQTGYLLGTGDDNFWSSYLFVKPARIRSSDEGSREMQFNITETDPYFGTVSTANTTNGQTTITVSGQGGGGALGMGDGHPVIDLGRAVGITSVANTTGTTATYTYTTTQSGSGSNAYVGMWINFTGFATHPAENNGSYLVTASTTTDVTVANTTAIAESVSANAQLNVIACSGSTNDNGNPVATLTLTGCTLPANKGTGTIGNDIDIALASVANTTGSTTTYTYASSQGGSAGNAYAGMGFNVTGFTAHSAQNNGSFLVTASNLTTITVKNTQGVAETTSVAHARHSVAQNVPQTIDGKPTQITLALTGLTSPGVSVGDMITIWDSVYIESSAITAVGTYSGGSQTATVYLNDPHPSTANWCVGGAAGLWVEATSATSGDYRYVIQALCNPSASTLKISAESSIGVGQNTNVQTQISGPLKLYNGGIMEDVRNFSNRNNAPDGNQFAVSSSTPFTFLPLTTVQNTNNITGGATQADKFGINFQNIYSAMGHSDVGYGGRVSSNLINDIYRNSATNTWVNAGGGTWAPLWAQLEGPWGGAIKMDYQPLAYCCDTLAGTAYGQIIEVHDHYPGSTLTKYMVFHDKASNGNLIYDWSAGELSWNQNLSGALVHGPQVRADVNDPNGTAALLVRDVTGGTANQRQARMIVDHSGRFRLQNALDSGASGGTDFMQCTWTSDGCTLPRSYLTSTRVGDGTNSSIGTTIGALNLYQNTTSEPIEHYVFASNTGVGITNYFGLSDLGLAYFWGNSSGTPLISFGLNNTSGNRGFLTVNGCASTAVAGQILCMNSGSTITATDAGLFTAASYKLASGTAMTGNQGNGTLLQHSSGSATTNAIVKFDSNGNAVNSGVSDDGTTVSTSEKVSAAQVTSVLNGQQSVASGATAAFDITHRSSVITLNQNLTSFTLSAPASNDGQEKTLIFCQDGTGGWTVSGVPASVKGFFTPGTTASTCSAQHFTYVQALSEWFADSPGVINQ